jgi:hypothetical protein
MAKTITVDDLSHLSYENGVLHTIQDLMNFLTIKEDKVSVEDILEFVNSQLINLDK